MEKPGKRSENKGTLLGILCTSVVICSLFYKQRLNMQRRYHSLKTFGYYVGARAKRAVW